MFHQIQYFSGKYQWSFSLTEKIFRLECGELFIRSFTSRETLSASENSQSFARMENWEFSEWKVFQQFSYQKTLLFLFLPGLKFHLQTGSSITFCFNFNYARSINRQIGKTHLTMYLKTFLLFLLIKTKTNKNFFRFWSQSLSEHGI